MEVVIVFSKSNEADDLEAKSYAGYFAPYKKQKKTSAKGVKSISNEFPFTIAFQLQTTMEWICRFVSDLDSLDYAPSWNFMKRGIKLELEEFVTTQLVSSNNFS